MADPLFKLNVFDIIYSIYFPFVQKEGSKNQLKSTSDSEHIKGCTEFQAQE